MKGCTKAPGMKMVVTPPPKFPQPDKTNINSLGNYLRPDSGCYPSSGPAEMPLALPTTLGANMSVFQNWFVTKVAPIIPMKKRKTT